MVPTIQALSLSGAPGVQLVANTLKKGGGISNALYVAQTYLQYASVIQGTTLTAWVTDVRGLPPPPVEGAEVTLFLGTYGSVGWRRRGEGRGCWGLGGHVGVCNNGAGRTTWLVPASACPCTLEPRVHCVMCIVYCVMPAR